MLTLRAKYSVQYVICCYLKHSFTQYLWLKLYRILKTFTSHHLFSSKKSLQLGYFSALKSLSCSSLLLIEVLTFSASPSSNLALPAALPTTSCIEVDGLTPVTLTASANVL